VRVPAPCDRLEERRQLGRHATEVDGGGEFEPVDAAGDVPGDAAGGAVAATRDLDEPAGGGKLRHRGVEPVSRDLDMVGGGRAVERLAAGRGGAVTRQQRERLAFRGPVAADEHAVRGVGGTPRRIVGGDRQARIVEPDPAGEMHAGLRPPPLARFGVERHGGRVIEHELGAGRPRLDPPAGPGGQDEPRHIGQERQPLDQAVDLRPGHLDRPPALELLEPARRDPAAVAVVDGLEPRDAV